MDALKVFKWENNMIRCMSLKDHDDGSVDSGLQGGPSRNPSRLLGGGDLH